MLRSIGRKSIKKKKLIKTCQLFGFSNQMDKYLPVHHWFNSTLTHIPIKWVSEWLLYKARIRTQPLKYVRFGVPSLPAGEQPDCGDLRAKEGFLIAESPSWAQKVRHKVKVRLEQKLYIIVWNTFCTRFHLGVISHLWYWTVDCESYLITQPMNNVHVVLSAVSVGEVVGSTSQLTRYFPLVNVSYASRNHGTCHRHCEVKPKSN